MLVETVNFDYILQVITQIIEANRQENIQEIEKQTQNSISQALPHAALDFQYNKLVSLNYLQYCLKNRAKLQLNLGMFDAEEDKEEILRYIYNNLYVALSSHNPPPSIDYLEQRAKYNAFLSGIQQNPDTTYTLKTQTAQYTLPINHFEKVVFYHKYGIDSLPSEAKTALADKDFIDAGAYIGDTALILNQYHPRRIYAFEPTPTNLALLNRTIALNNITNLIAVPKALSQIESTSNMFTWDNASFLADNGTEQVKTTTIDAFSQQNGLQVGLVKMDIEGAESNAIAGAEQTIKEQKPVLLIALYHTGRDFFEIPTLLKDWVPTYKFRFLNLHRLAPVLERVLVAYKET